MQKKNIIFISLLIAGVLLLLAPETGFAISLKNPLGASFPTGQEAVYTIIGNIIQFVLGFVGSAAILMFVYGGFMYLTSGGNPEKIGQGKNIVVWAVIGLICVLGSYVALATIIGAFTGNPLTTTLPPGSPAEKSPTRPTTRCGDLPDHQCDNTCVPPEWTDASSEGYCDTGICCKKVANSYTCENTSHYKCQDPPCSEGRASAPEGNTCAPPKQCCGYTCLDVTGQTCEDTACSGATGTGACPTGKNCCGP